MNKWILDRDYKPAIRQEVKQVIMGNDDYTLKDAEQAAIEIVSGYLRSKYDTTLIFIHIPKFVTDTQYNLGDYVHDANDTIFKALVNNPGNILTDPAKWVASDPRNKALLMVVIDVTLYYLHSNISPRNMPELRVKRYDDAIAWLKMVQSEKVTPDLPILTDVVTPNYTLGSREKTTDRW